ncbi:MAG TPA: hypothetical protein VMZ30_18755 [Pyrinomonadaceae bacterium]|nr:hypothetical protein [Pyrinomonadaceae bacterium]
MGPINAFVRLDVFAVWRFGLLTTARLRSYKPLYRETARIEEYENICFKFIAATSSFITGVRAKD